jgi:lipopolysaccharide/colanic/teichoic acid biosynthesis glycosyltransferase
VATCSDLGVEIAGVTLASPNGQPASPKPVIRGTARAVKRIVDFVGAGLGLVVTAPLLAAVAVLILILDGRPMMFRQQRAGLDGRAFQILKFRTMARDADPMRADLRDSIGLEIGAFKMADDPRVTRLGYWLRRTSIDELPQLWNVLKGDMSLVGPRPHPYDDVARYKPWHLRRLSAKPGMTGLWQVELRGDPDFDRCVEKDIEYIERRSLRLDVSILLRTIPAVLRGTGR